MFVIFLIFSLNEAKIAYNHGLYGVARLGFIEALKKGENSSACYYYLTRVAEATSSDIEVYRWGTMFLSENPLDPKAKEIADVILKSLLRQRWSYGLKDFLSRYGRLIDKDDFLTATDSMIAWHEPGAAAQLLLDAGGDVARSRAIAILDSIGDYKIVARLAAKEPSGFLHRAKAGIMTGDTLSAFYDFLSVDPLKINNKNLYSKLALDFGLAKIGRAALGKGGDPLLKTKLSLTMGDQAKAHEYLSRIPVDSLKNHLDLCLQAEYLVPVVVLIGSDNKTINRFYDLAIKKGRFDDAYLLASLLGDQEKIKTVRDVMLGKGKESQEEEGKDSLRLLARRFEEAGKYDTAYKYYHEMKDNEGLARVLYHLGKYKLAYKLTRNDSLRFLILKATDKSGLWIIKRNLKDAWAKIEYARNLIDNKNPVEALGYLIACQGPGRVSLMVKALDRMGRDSLAIRLIRGYELSDDHSLGVLYDLNDFDQILNLTKSKKDSISRLYRVKALVRKGRITVAKKILKGIDRRAYYEAVCEYLIKKKRFSKVDSIINKIQKKSPKLNYLYTLIPFYRGDFESAVKRLGSYLKTQNGFRNQAIFKLGTSYYQLGDFDKARDYFRLLLNERKLKGNALHNLIICLKKIGDWDAIIDLRSDIINDPNYLFEIGYAYLRKGMNQKALTIFEEVRRDIYNAEVQYWLAEAKSGSGDIKGALLEYYRLYLDFPDDPQWRITAYFKMGLILEIIGDMQGAKAIYHKILKRGKGDVWYEEAKSRLDNLD